MNKDYKAKLLEKAGIYVDCCQLLNSFSTKELKHS